MTSSKTTVLLFIVNPNFYKKLIFNKLNQHTQFDENKKYKMDQELNLIPHCNDLTMIINIVQNENDERFQIILDEKYEYTTDFMPLINKMLDNKLCEMFTRYMIDLIMNAIKLHISAKKMSQYEIKLYPNYHHKFTANIGYHYKSLKMHEILYGKINGGPLFLWTNRVPCFANAKNPFKELQIKLYNDKQLLLVDNSDNNISYLPHIVILLDLPCDYNDTELLWHGLNKLPDELLLEYDKEEIVEEIFYDDDPWDDYDCPYNQHDEVFADPRE